jgi:fibronectin-binding autotransporter adhesin
VTNVSVDLSSIGGSSAARLALSATANVYTNTFTIPSGAPTGSAALAVTATDNTPLSATYGVTFTVLPNNVVWTGGSALNNNWSTSSNWLGNFGPLLSGNNVFFAGATRLTPNMDNSYSVSGMTFSNTAGSFTIGSSVGGTLTVGSGGIANNSANPQTLNVPVAMSAAQTFNLTGGLTLNSNLTGGVDVTLGGAGTLTLAGTGTNTLGDLRASSGQVNITGGIVNVTDASGSLTRVESNATIVVSGGTLNIFDGGNGWFPIGVTAGSTGAVVVAGGIININDHWGTEVGNESGAGLLIINSGAFTNNDIAGIGLLLSDGASTGGEIDLNGGALVVNKIGVGSGAGGNFYFNGGTLMPVASNAGFWNNSGLVSASIRNGGAVVNSAGFNVTIGQPLLHSTVAGDNATDGGLTKTGNGTLTLSSGYSYTGPNKVLGGTLNLNLGLGVAGSGGDLVVSNATLVLDASGGIALPAANVALDSGAVLNFTNYAFANAVSGTGSLLVQTNTILNLNYGALGGNPNAAAINVAGAISVAGTNNVITITGTGFTAGEVPLIQYGSGSLASISGFKLGPIPSGVNAVLTNDTANKMVALNITFVGQTLTWYGTNSLWNINTTYNWNTATAKYLEYGTSPNIFGDLVTFDDTLYNDGINPQATNVNLTTTLHPSQITENSSLPYSFTGAGSLAGAGSLTMNGSGSLTLGTANSYTGGTFVNAGTLIVTNDSALGASTGALTLNGGTVQFNGNTASARPVLLAAASVVDVVPGVAAQWSGPLTGAGDLTLNDFGTLTLSPAVTNSFGNLRVSNGQLNITSGAVNVSDTQGSSTRIENNAMVVVSGGTLNIVGSNILNGWFPIGVTAGSTGTVVVAGGTINVNDHWGTEVGNESGTGILTINSGTFINNDAGNVGLLIADGSSPQGTVNLNGGALVVRSLGAGAGAGGQVYLNGGTLRAIASNTGFWNNSTKITAAVRNGGAVVDSVGFNLTLGQVLSHSAVAGDNALDGGLTKVGNGTLSLNGVNSYTGPTVINGGALAGTGTIAGALANNATLAPGSGTTGALTVIGNITLNAGATNTFAVNGSTLANSSVAAGGVVTYGGLLNLVPSGTFTNGQKFQLFSGAGATNASNFAGIAGSPGSGLAFSFTNGVLSVVAGGPSGPAPITSSYSGGVLSLSWPAGQGWRLQMQTNSLSAGLNTNWVYQTDGSVSSTNITVDATKPTAFYRLTYP